MSVQVRLPENAAVTIASIPADNLAAFLDITFGEALEIQKEIIEEFGRQA